MADQEAAVPAPHPPPALVPVPQAPHGQHLVHLNWSNFKPEIS